MVNKGYEKLLEFQERINKAGLKQSSVFIPEYVAKDFASAKATAKVYDLSIETQGKYIGWSMKIAIACMKLHCKVKHWLRN